MKIVTYLREGQDNLAFYLDGTLYDMPSVHPDLPSSMTVF